MAVKPDKTKPVVRLRHTADLYRKQKSPFCNESRDKGNKVLKLKKSPSFRLLPRSRHHVSLEFYETNKLELDSYAAKNLITIDFLVNGELVDYSGLTSSKDNSSEVDANLAQDTAEDSNDGKEDLQSEPSEKEGKDNELKKEKAEVPTPDVPEEELSGIKNEEEDTSEETDPPLSSKPSTKNATHSDTKSKKSRRGRPKSKKKKD